MSSLAQGREARKRTLTAIAASSPPQQRKRQKVQEVGDATHSKPQVPNEASIPIDFKHRIGSTFIGHPKWQTGQIKHQLGKAQKRMIGVIKELCKRKGGQFFSRPVDPVDQGLDDYFDVVVDPLDLGTIIKNVEEGFYSSGMGGLKWHERLARDVEQVWSNALLYNPPENIVSEAAKELRDTFNAQLAKVVEECGETTAEASSLNDFEKAELMQLVLDDFVFRNESEQLLTFETLMQTGFAGSRLGGLLVKNRLTRSDVPSPTLAFEFLPTSIHLEHLDAKDDKTGSHVAVWIRTPMSWIRLLEPSSLWESFAKPWLEQMRLCGQVSKAFSESSRDTPPERIVRSAMKAAFPKSFSKVEEERVNGLLLQCAEYATLCVENRAQAADEGKISLRDSRKLVRKLLQDAEKERARKLNSEMGATLHLDDPKDGLAVCGALLGAISRVELDSMRHANAEGLAVSEVGRPDKKLLFDHGEPSTPQTGKAPSRFDRKEFTKKPNPKDAPKTPKEPSHTADASSGYWERDAQGVRRWVSDSAPSVQVDHSDHPKTTAGPKKNSEELLAENPLDYSIGARVRVLFEDQVWYVGQITAFDKKSKKYHVVFSDGDEDDIAMPDPDVILVCPVDLLLQALDEASDSLRRGLKDFVQSDLGKGFSENADDLRKKLYSQYRSYKEALQRTVTGKVPESNWSLEGVKAQFAARAHTKLVELGMTEKQWQALVEVAAKTPSEQSAPRPEPEAIESEPHAKKPKHQKVSSKGKGERLDVDTKAHKPDEVAVKKEKATGKGERLDVETKTIKPDEVAVKKEKASEIAVKQEKASEGAVRKEKASKPSTSATPKRTHSDHSLPTTPHSRTTEKEKVAGPAMELEDVNRTPAAQKERRSTVDDSTARSTSKKGKRKNADGAAMETPSKENKKSPGKSSEAPEVSPGSSKKGDGDNQNVKEGRVKSDWSNTPDWLKKNAMIEVLWEKDWWQAKAVKCINGKVGIHYIGDSVMEMEWISIKSKRLRPPSEDWDKSIVGSLGEVVEVKRPDKKTQRNKWFLATVIKCDNTNVQVRYSDRPDVEEEWVTLDAKTVRKVEKEKLPQQEPATEKLRTPLIVRLPARSPWPEGDASLAGKWDSESMSSCMMVKHFLRAFGRSQILVQDGSEAGRSVPSVDLEVPQMLESMGEAFKVSEWLTAFFVRTLNVIVKHESGSGPIVLPDALNWTAWLRRLLDKDILELGRRMIKDRLEESYLSEEALAEYRISKNALSTKNKRIQIPDPARPYEGMNGEQVTIQGGPLLNREVVKGQISASPETGLWITCFGVKMTVSDFTGFCGIVMPDQETPVVRVTREECSLAEWEANLRKEKAAEDDVAGTPAAGPDVGDHLRAFEALLGPNVFKREKELMDILGRADWEDVPVALRWRGASWLCDAVAETEVFRTGLQEQTSDLDKQQPTTTGWTLFLTKMGGMKNAKLASEHWNADEAARNEFNEKARIIREQEAAQKKADKEQKQAAPFTIRQEPLGCDESNRRYWWTAWTDRQIGVEKAASKTKSDKSVPFPRAGGSRMLPYEADSDWVFFNSPEELDMLEAYLDENSELETKLLKHFQAERAAFEASQAGGEKEETEQVADSKQPAEQAAAASAVAVAEQPDFDASSAVRPPQISVLPSAPPGLVGMLPQQPNQAGGLPGQAGMPPNPLQQAQALPFVRTVPIDALEKYPHRGEYFAREDETPAQIAEFFGLDTDAVVDLNKELYAGLHSKARFKAGTLLILPTPTAETLGKSPLRPREHILSDTVAIVLLAMQVVPMSVLLSGGLIRMADSIRKADAVVNAVVAALMDLEHAMLLPMGRITEHRLEDRLLPVEWLKTQRKAWMLELEAAKTWSQVGLLLQEFYLMALTKIQNLRRTCTTRWMFRVECQKSLRPGALPQAQDQALVLLPMKGEIVVYLRRGHMQHLDHYPQRPWDSVPVVPVASCIVEDTWFFKAGDGRVPFCALQLRPIFQQKALIGKQIIVGELPPNALARRVPTVCLVTDMREVTQTWLPAAPGAPGMTQQGAPQKSIEYMLRWDSGEPDSWVCLERAKYQLVRPDEAGPPFFATIHYEQVLPEFLVTLKTFRESERVWAKGTPVRMWWRNDEAAGGGEFYTGEVIEQKDDADPWDSVHVIWDSDEGLDEDWVCPWELQVWNGPRNQRYKGVALQSSAGAADPAGEPVDKSIISTPQQAATLQYTGIHIVENDDETAHQIAQALGVDSELLVQMNRGDLPGLTKHAKLHKQTRLRIPPKGLRFERAAPTGGQSRQSAHKQTHAPLEQRAFPKEDEVWWEGGWTDEKLHTCNIVLRRVMRHRNSSVFLEAVDVVALGLDDYLDVIKTPMDLGTVSKKMSDGDYAVPADFRADLRLVFENAKLYNPPTEQEHKTAVKMIDMFEEMWREEKDRTELLPSGKRKTLGGL